jgi:phosphoglycerate dehydrogenase-like enzyme
MSTPRSAPRLRVLFCEPGYSESRRRLAALVPEYELLTAQKDRLNWSLTDVDVIVPYGARIDHSTIERGRFGLIQQFGVGLETIDIAAATECGVWVARVPSAHTGNAESVAEHAILLMLALSRRAAELPQAVQRRVIGEPAGIALAGKTACIIGLGGVGAALARRLQAFDMRLRGVRAQAILGAPSGVGMKVFPAAQLHAAVADADYVIVCTTMDASNANLINSAALLSMKRGAFLINVARGGLVDTAALEAALASGHLAGAGLDVVADEPIDPTGQLLKYNVIITPHVAGVTDVSYEGIAREVANNLRRYEQGMPPAYAVNAPSAPRASKVVSRIYSRTEITRK